MGARAPADAAFENDGSDHGEHVEGRRQAKR